MIARSQEEERSRLSERLYVIEYKDNRYYVIQVENGSEVMVRNGLFTSGAVQCGQVKAWNSPLLRQASVIKRTRLLPGAKEALER